MSLLKRSSVAVNFQSDISTFKSLALAESLYNLRPPTLNFTAHSLTAKPTESKDSECERRNSVTLIFWLVPD